jgi:hypothetical protein
MFTAYETSNIILHVILICLFIIILFLTYGVYLEKQVLSNQIKYTITKFTDNITPFLPPNTNINEVLKLNETPDSANVTSKISENNSAVFNKIFKYSGILVLIGLLSIFIISYKSKRMIDGEVVSLKTFLKQLFKDNIILLVFVALVYAGFVTYISYTYIYVDVNLLKRNIIDTLIKFRDDPKIKNLDSTSLPNLDLKNLNNLTNLISQFNNKNNNNNLNNLNNLNNSKVDNNLYDDKLYMMPQFND